MERVLRQHLETFLSGMYRQIRRTIWRVLRTGLIAFTLWVVAGGVVLTLLILGLGASPQAPLALVSYATMVLAGLAVAVAASAVHVCVAALRGIERAARDAIAEVGRLEGTLARTVSSTISPRPPGDGTPGER